MLKGMTAESLIRRCRPVQAGETILVHAAVGGVGLLLCQWAKALGARVIGTVGGEAKAEIARAHGCDEVILYRTEDVAARVKALTDGVGVPVVFDSVGASTFEGSLASLARRGMLVTFGNASGPVPPVAPLQLSRGGSLYLTRPTLFDYTSTVEELEASANALFDVILNGTVKVRIGSERPLVEARHAHEALEGRETIGATLLIP
jgi:NADPH2:quinone reductase